MFIEEKFKPLKSILIYGLFIIAVDCCLLFLYTIFPRYRVHFTKENMLLENLTVLVFVCTFLLAVGWLIWKRPRLHAGWLIFLAFTGFLSALDEIQFIGLIIYFFNPNYGPIKFDAIHDLVGYVIKIFFRAARKHQVEPFIYAGIGLGIAFILVAVFWRLLKEPLLRLVKSTPFYFLIITIILLYASTRLDMGAIRIADPRLWEEIIEFDGALALLFCCLSVTFMR